MGYRLSVGDIDGDGLDDILTTGFGYQDVATAWLVLGSTLAGLEGVACEIGDVADYGFLVDPWDLKGLDPSGSQYCRGCDVGLLLTDGPLYIGNTDRYDPSIPLVYRMNWASLAAAGPGTHALADVADVQFHGDSKYVGESLASCDVNGDEEQDLVLGAEASRAYGHEPGYVLLGPFPARRWTSTRRRSYSITAGIRRRGRVRCRV